MKTCREIEEFGRHQELSGSRKLAKYEKDYFPRILDGSATEVDLTSALENLSKMLTEHYGKTPVIIIDEYDTPIQEGYAKDFYDNKNLSFGFLIGILRIVQESIFSGMNNLTILLWTKNMTVSLDLPVQKYMR